MLCETAREHLSTLSDGERLNDWRQLVLTRQHCLTCPACRTYRRQLKQISRTARHLPVSLPTGLRERVLSQLPRANTVTPQTYTTAHTTNARRRELAMFKRLTAITGAVLVAAVAATLTTKRPFRQQINMQPSNANKREQLILNDLAAYKGLQESLQSQLENREDEASLANAKNLREHWHGWAMQHRAELHQMLCVRGTDQTVMMRVYNLLPTAFRSNTRDNMAAFLEHHYDLSWQIMPTPEIETQVHRKTVLNDFAIYHDVRMLAFGKILNDDVNNPQLEYMLWASGRITKDKRLKHASVNDNKITPSESKNTLKNGNNTSAFMQADTLYLTYNVFSPFDELTR